VRQSRAFSPKSEKHLRALPPYRPSPSCNTQSTTSSPTTTTFAPTGRCTAAHQFKRSTTGPKPSPAATKSRRTTACHDTSDAAGVITIRHNSRLHHIGSSKRRRGTKVTVLIDDLDIRVLHHDTGTLIRKLILNPTRDYQPLGGKYGNSPENRLQM
jgi:hypothetical protein